MPKISCLVVVDAIFNSLALTVCVWCMHECASVRDRYRKVNDILFLLANVFDCYTVGGATYFEL